MEHSCFKFDFIKKFWNVCIQKYMHLPRAHCYKGSVNVSTLYPQWTNSDNVQWKDFSSIPDKKYSIREACQQSHQRPLSWSSSSNGRLTHDIWPPSLTLEVKVKEGIMRTCTVGWLCCHTVTMEINMEALYGMAEGYLHIHRSWAILITWLWMIRRAMLENQILYEIFCNSQCLAQYISKTWNAPNLYDRHFFKSLYKRRGWGS